MTLDQLRMLVAVAETGSILAAAEKLYRTQPTVTVGLRKLEEELGVMLLDRQHYRAKLTTEGELLCHRARNILHRTGELEDLARHLRSGHEAELTLAIEASCPMPLVLELLKETEQKFPHTQITLTADTLWGAIEKVKLNEADLAISPWFQDDEALESIPLTTTTLTTVAAPDFPPFRDSRPLQLDDLRESVQVVIRDSSTNPPATKYGLVDGGRRWLVNDHETKKKIILAGMGWGRLQNHLITEELATGRLIPLSITGYQGIMQVDIRVVRRSAQLPGPVTADLWQRCAKLSLGSHSI
ncbi:MAG TPA: LysR family transcriptional regulator [Geothermobacteraceae bacterium]|nr:LysR family transcriptional regulator [Geothermobacteraceae bacterium]